MTNRVKKKALWLDTESTYGTDPSANGSGYTALPTVELSDLRDEYVLEETNLFTGRGHKTEREPVQDGWSFDMTMYVWGLLTAAGDGTNASSVSDDVLDQIMMHIFGTQRTTVGANLGTPPDSTGMLVDAGDPYDIQDLVAIHEASVPTPERTQWALVTADNGTQDYDIAPAYVTTPSAASVAYGAKIYTFDDDDGGATCAFVYREGGQDYTLLGGRCTSATLECVAGRAVRLRLSWRGDTKTAESKGSLPTAISTPILTPIIFTRSPFFFGGTKYQIQRANIDLGLNTAVLEGSEGANGRVGDEAAGAGWPTFDVNPEKTTALEDLKRNATKGRVLLQLGGGVLSGGVLNTMCMHAEQAQAPNQSEEDDNNRRRIGITFEVQDNVVFSGAVNTRVFQWARA